MGNEFSEARDVPKTRTVGGRPGQVLRTIGQPGTSSKRHPAKGQAARGQYGKSQYAPAAGSTTSSVTCRGREYAAADDTPLRYKMPKQSLPWQANVCDPPQTEVIYDSQANTYYKSDPRSLAASAAVRCDSMPPEPRRLHDGSCGELAMEHPMSTRCARSSSMPATSREISDLGPPLAPLPFPLLLPPMPNWPSFHGQHQHHGKFSRSSSMPPMEQPENLNFHQDGFAPLAPIGLPARPSFRALHEPCLCSHPGSLSIPAGLGASFSARSCNGPFSGSSAGSFSAPPGPAMVGSPRSFGSRRESSRLLDHHGASEGQHGNPCRMNPAPPQAGPPLALAPASMHAPAGAHPGQARAMSMLERDHNSCPPVENAGVKMANNYPVSPGGSFVAPVRPPPLAPATPKVPMPMSHSSSSHPAEAPSAFGIVCGPAASTTASTAQKKGDNFNDAEKISRRMNELLSVCKRRLISSRRRAQDAEEKLQSAEDDLARIGHDWQSLEGQMEVARTLFNSEATSPTSSSSSRAVPKDSVERALRGWDLLAEAMSQSGSPPQSVPGKHGHERASALIVEALIEAGGQDCKKSDEAHQQQHKSASMMRWLEQAYRRERGLETPSKSSAERHHENASDGLIMPREVKEQDCELILEISASDVREERILLPSKTSPVASEYLKMTKVPPPKPRSKPNASASRGGNFYATQADRNDTIGWKGSSAWPYM